MNTNNIVNDEENLNAELLEGLEDPDAVENQECGSFPFDDPDFQRELCSAILTDAQWLAFASTRIKPKYFVSRGHQVLIETTYQYWEAYAKLPTPTVLRMEIKERLKDHKSLPFFLSELETTVGKYLPGLESNEYIRDKMIGFAKSRAAQALWKGFLDDCRQGKADLGPRLDQLQKELRDIEQAFGLATALNDYQLYDDQELEGLEGLEWQVGEHFPCKGTVTIFGASGAGKSFYALDMGLSIATGLPFLGRYPVKQGKVLYICSEGAYGLKARIRAWKQHHGITGKIEGVAYSTVCHNLQERGEVEKLIAKARAKLGSIQVVIVDTLSRNFGGGDTDKNQDMQKYLGNVDYLREQTGAAVISIHHTGWQETKRERGAKSLRDYSDSSILVTKDGDDCEISCQKQKDASEFEPYRVVRKHAEGSLYLEYVGSTGELQQDQKEQTEGERLNEILDLIPDLDLETEPSESNTITISTLRDKTGMSNSELDRRLKILLEQTAIERGKIGEGNKARLPYRYWQYGSLSP